VLAQRSHRAITTTIITTITITPKTSPGANLPRQMEPGAVREF